MNPFGRPVTFPAANGGQLRRDEEPPHISTILYGTWLVVYSWPAVKTLTPQPPTMILDQPSKLESVLFGCRCREEVADKLYPIKVITDKTEVQACELINEEAQVEVALNRTNCECRATPLGEKFAALPINENIVLHYQRLSNVVYPFESSNTCKLLFKYLPSSLEIDKAVEGMAVARRSGDVTFMIKQE